jgi:hypothetical protein
MDKEERKEEASYLHYIQRYKDKKEIDMKLSEMSEVDKNDFVIRLRLSQYDSGEWTGDVDICIVTQEKNDLSTEDYDELMHLSRMIAASVPLMEKNQELRELIHNIVKRTSDNNLEVTYPREVNKIDKKDNIITIDFKGKKPNGSDE